MKSLLLFAALCVISFITPAQTVYRCGPQGREYSQTPCLQGRAIDVGDARSAEQRDQARALAEDEAARADAMQRQRRTREASTRPAQAGKIDGRLLAVVQKPEMPSDNAKVSSTKKKQRSAAGHAKATKKKKP